MPSFTFYATAEAALVLGARPVFCDIDPDTFCVTPRDRRGGAHPAHEGDRAGAPVRQRRAGPELRELGVPVLEDAAQAAGARLGGAAAGALGDAATFSFFPSKNLPCLGDGGAIVTDDDEIAERARVLRFHGSKDKITFTDVGYNSRLDELQAAVLRVLLPELDGWTERRGEAAAAYERLGLGEHVRLPAHAPERAARLPPLRRALGARAAGGPRLLPHARAPPAGDRGRRRPARHRGGRAHQLRAADGDRADRGAGAAGRGRMRVWVDLTNSPHVLVMRPLIEAMRADGHEVEVTARDFAQTLELCERFGIEHTAIGRHRGGRLASKAVGLASRSGALARWARGRRFDVAIGHGSNDVSVAAALLRIPSATAFDYEFAAAAAPRELPALPRRDGPGGDPARAARTATARKRASCAATRG